MANAKETEAAVNEIKVPDGIIQPPLVIKAIIEKTSGYIVRSGRRFEERILQKEAGNPKFSFLTPDDPFNKYYEWRIHEVSEGRGTDVAAGRQGESAAIAVGQQQGRAKKAGEEKPPDYHFSARMPNITAQDLDVIKLTALFAARNGKQWITQLSHRESNNRQFDFLRPQHSLNSFFTRLIEQYKELLDPAGAEARLKEIEKSIQDKYHVLTRAKQRAQYLKQQQSQREQQAEKEEAERIAYAQIDWHDFVVVETVVFDEADEQTDLPPPTTQNDIMNASLEEKGKMSLQPPSRRIEEAMPDEMINGYAHGMTPQPPLVQALPPQPQSSPQGYLPFPHQPPPSFPTNSGLPQRPPSNVPPYLPAAPPSASPPAASAFNPPPPLEHNRLASPVNAGAGIASPSAQPNHNAAPTNIRTDYQPRAAARARQKEQTAQCPICKEAIPLSQYNEHVQIEQIDPRWREQRAKEQARNSTTNLSTSDVANNLKRLASQRTDVFDGVTGEVISEEEKERRKRAARGYDGVIPGLVRPGPLGRDSTGQQGGGVNLDEQLARIKAKAQGGG